MPAARPQVSPDVGDMGCVFVSQFGGLAEALGANQVGVHGLPVVLRAEGIHLFLLKFIQDDASLVAEVAGGCTPLLLVLEQELH